MIVNKCFHNVGQGLFYTEMIKTKENITHSVFDCGSTQKEKVEICIKYYKKYINKTKFIDHLFISHLHKDHISGLDYLLENYEIKNIYLPYYSPALRILIGAGEKWKKDWYFDFLTNPINYIIQKDRVRNIHYIYGLKNESGKDVVLIDNDHIYSEMRINYFSDDYDEFHRVNFHHINQFRIIENDWIFELMNIGLDIAQYRIINNKINELLGDKFIINKRNINIIKKLYSIYKNNLNDISLIVYSGPEKKEYFYRENYYCPYLCCVNSNKELPGTMMTGDTNLSDNSNYNLYWSRYNMYFNTIGLFQVPHHGSFNGWNDAMIKDHNKSFFIINAGQDNQYNHPDDNVTLTIKNNLLQYFIISEHDSLDQKLILDI